MKFLDIADNEVVELVATGDMPEAVHQFEPRQIRAVNAALAARRPLLVRGEPGIGKSQLARAAAKGLGRAFVPHTVDARTESRDLLWHFDAVARLAEAQLLGALGRAADLTSPDPAPPPAEKGGQPAPNLRDRLAIACFLHPRALWWAFDWNGALDRAKAIGISAPPQPDGGDPANGCLVLIDEIDKAEMDVPNGLLEALGAGSFHPQGCTEPVKATGIAPLVVITTNEERALPDAFVRRCLVLHLRLPSDPRKLAERLIARGHAHFDRHKPPASDKVLQRAAELLVADRETARENHWLPLPGQAEYLDLVRAVITRERTAKAQEALMETVAEFVLKNIPMPSNESPSKTPTRPRGACGRADLAVALADGNTDLALAMAEFAGYEWRAPEREQEKKPEKEPDGGWGERPEPPAPEIVTRPLAETPFWQPTRYEPLEKEGEPAPQPPTTPYRGWSLRPQNPPVIPPLADWRELEPKLRRPLCLPQPGRAVDLESTVRLLGQALFLAELPRERRRRWGPTLHVIEDRSARLIPYRLDQYLVREALRRLLPAHALDRSVFRDGMSAPHPPEGDVGSIMLVLGDLGCLSGARAELCERWLHFGRDLRAAGRVPVALVPGPLERCPDRLACVWRLIPWERPRPRDPEEPLEQRAARLLRLVSPAVRIEPGLLRAARLLLPPDQADAGTEADVWQHPDLIGRSAAGATLNPERAKQLREEFASRLAPDLQARFAGLLRAWRGYLPEEIWFEELLNLPPAAQATAEVVQDLPCARDYFADFVRDCGEGGTAASGGDLEWFSRVERRAERLWGDERVGDDLKRLSYALHEQDPNYRFPTDFRPDLIRRPDRPVRRLAIKQQSETLEFVAAEALPSGSHLADCTSRNGLIRIDPLPIDLDRNTFWRSGQPPSWADDWGTDNYGHWVTFSVEGVTQKMHWIEPGTFLMGSPEDEPERYDNEGPQHQVTIRQGFWLFDTACTQTLWETVMHENPSRFKGAQHPVENVSWHDCQEFLKRLNERVPGLDLTLPSETQWEYACRAGTTTPFSFGTNITPEQVNYNGNHPYAGGKTGLNRQQTSPVASLPPDRWGLYEMHGNVWEWCQDHWHGNYEGVPTDGSAWLSSAAGARRVLRGGSWYGSARNARAAYRFHGRPDYHRDIIGFRCARVNTGAEPTTKPEQSQPGGATGAEPTLLRLDASPFPVRCPLPQAPTFFIHTDREHLTFRRLTKPSWASAIGRDRFGLWCEIEIDPGRGEPVVQRLRWIPPGRFWMGSPEKELGRYDDEGPRHFVTLTEGYWLFDTPCTQALWKAVMEKNPSRFQSPTRPVEQVSWHDAQNFLRQLNGRIADLNLTLPSEAQWEYACRAGTETAIYTGDLAILGKNDAPALDPVAWYGGNCGVDFDLKEGHDSSGWPEKQYPHTKAGTHPVKLKRANPWGLYDMLGNVLEWIQDYWHSNYQDAPTDGSVWENRASDAARVLRGGSWSYDARGVRAAPRRHLHPNLRRDNIGFRCIRVRGEPSQPAAG